ncbi:MULTISPECIES: NAD(P)H-dependent oxidoreductase [unclassified Leeuwenhoekiella]|uniref:NAD(P)H-dependent oxidoreductase n=1 Tax=unclassified Leeuwenhoekiella TaxID=2615029 RepID=UPI000C3957E2|nr:MULTISPECIES: NAD(P)H-dependent oxidoreductase [unclassified Leeuwenhoekiella]MAW95623.1 NAD(P)H-dependent oxidoreductase [Leeuwenhoekiella sp.]MBA82285.1 NAD(P)H-dependent oxidoreductase [Leeuwenhoekiella sp.]|tara:strand:+ start:982 stop:1611 length:630 start_codon:yes stop_codon:yes gene_type:complete
MNVLKSLNWRYAVKKFDPNQKLTASKLEVLTEAFNLTATSYGLQPLRLVVVSDKDMQEQLVEASMNQTQVRDASHVLVICVEKEVRAPYVDTYFDRVREVRDTPETILKPFRETLKKQFHTQDAEKTRQWAINQAYLALGNLLTVCALEAIDACPMEGFVPEKYDELLKLDKLGITSTLVLPVGYRAADDMFADFEKVRRSTEDTIIRL